MSDYIIVDGSLYSDDQRQRFIADVKRLLDRGYSLGGFTREHGYAVAQVMYKTALPQGALIDNKVALGSMGLGSMGLREGSKGGSRRRLTNSSRPRRGLRHSASRPRKATSKRRSRSQK